MCATAPYAGVDSTIPAAVAYVVILGAMFGDAGCDPDALSPDADLRETLELDSLGFLRVVELLSERAHVRIDEEDYPFLATLTGAATWLTGVAPDAPAPAHG